MSQQLSITQALNSPDSKNKFQELLGKRASQFITSVLAVVNNSKLLQSANWESIYSAAITAATLDLPINPNLGFAYIVPYGKEAQFQIGYKGFIQLAQRSGKFKTINVTDVREGEIEDFDRLTGSIQFNWIKEDREKKPVVGYVAYFELLNGFSKLLYMTVDELNAHGVKYSQTAKKGFGLWKDNFSSMASKTTIKLLLSKYAPLSTQMEVALTTDQAIINGDNLNYVDNESSINVEAAPKKSELHLFIENEVETIEALQAIEKNIQTEEEQLAFDIKMEMLNTPTTSDGSLIEEEKQKVNV